MQDHFTSPSDLTSIFESLPSLLNPHELKPIGNFYLPYPSQIAEQQAQKFPNIFTLSPVSKSKLVTACPHSARKHYAKNMCNNCYHRLGRSKNAWDCPHSDRKLYAKGKCQFCYIQDYNRAKGPV